MAPGDFSQMTAEELRSYLSKNQEPLELVRLGLRRECVVPTQNSMDYIQSHITNLASIKHLGRMLSAEARLAEMNMNHEEAARIHSEVIRLGDASSRGGLIIDKLVGIAIEHIGMEGLERKLSQLNKDSCLMQIRTLEDIEIHAETAQAYLEKDRQWSRHAADTGALSMWIQSVIMTKSLFPNRQSERRFITKLHATDLRRRQLLLNLAARAYELERGKKPVRAEDLVPSVLRTLPKAPETGTNLVLNLSK